jgi:Spy/CpxP family protein refolding chaperone
MQAHRSRFVLHAVALAAAALLTSAAAAGQTRPSGLPGDAGRRDAGHDGARDNGGLSIGTYGNELTRTPLSGNTRIPAAPSKAETQGGLQLGPSGRWWDNKEFARHVGLNSYQQHRMDDVFGANKDNLMKLYKNLQGEESRLRKLTRNGGVDENLIFQQIDRVTTARGELEKANAHMLLQIRKELTPDQTAKLDEQHPPE